MGRTKTVLVFAAVLVAFVAARGGSALANTPRPSTGNGVEPIGSAAWPAVPAQLAENITRDSFAHDYSKVWAYLHPTYRHVISQTSWQRCQAAHPAAPRQDKITKVSISSASQVPVGLALLGQQNVQEIQLLVQFTTPVARGTQVAVLSTFWLKQGSTWRAVWLSDEYAAYKAGACYLTPQGPPLY